VSARSGGVAACGVWAEPSGSRFVAAGALIAGRAQRARPGPSQRFLSSRPGTYTWLPFGGGVYRCVGAEFVLFEARVLLRTLLQHRRLSAVDGLPAGTGNGCLRLGRPPTRPRTLILPGPGRPRDQAR
jgi:hypothetical protein